MADRVILDTERVMDKACIYTMKVADRVHCQLMICRGHIRASKGAFQIFLVKFCTLFSFWLQFQRNTPTCR